MFGDTPDGIPGDASGDIPGDSEWGKCLPSLMPGGTHSRRAKESCRGCSTREGKGGGCGILSFPGKRMAELSTLLVFFFP